MGINKKNVARTLTIVVVVLFFSMSLALAGNGPGTIDSIIFELDGEYYEVDIQEWADAYRDGEGNPLYEKFKEATIVGLVSGDKYIDMQDYADKYRDNPATAIDESDELDSDIIDKCIPYDPDLPIDEVTAEDLGVDVKSLVPGAFNIIIPFEDASDLLGATEDDILELNIDGDIIELNYNEGNNEFVKTGVQGYTEDQIKQAIVTVKEDPEEVIGEDLGVDVKSLVPGAFNIIIPFEDASDLLGATEDDILELNIDGDIIELNYNEGNNEFVKTGVQGYTEDQIKQAIVTIK